MLTISAKLCTYLVHDFPLLAPFTYSCEVVHRNSAMNSAHNLKWKSCSRTLKFKCISFNFICIHDSFYIAVYFVILLFVTSKLFRWFRATSVVLQAAFPLLCCHFISHSNLSFRCVWITYQNIQRTQIGYFTK